MATVTLTEAEQAALDKWAEIACERASIEEFLNWTGERMHWRAIMPLTDLLDLFYGIDRKNLESGRRALLASTRE